MSHLIGFLSATLVTLFYDLPVLPFKYKSWVQNLAVIDSNISHHSNQGYLIDTGFLPFDLYAYTRLSG